MNDVIKEYLVSLGFSVDNTSYAQMMGTFSKLENGINKFKSVAVADFAAAASAVTGFVAIATVSIFEFLEALAKADLQNDMFARKMWMNPENARAMQSSLKAMDAEMEDLYYSPELLKNFIKLRQQAKEMSTPDDMRQMYKFIRSITFEFQRLKLEATYALQWIGYYLIKYLEKPLEKFKFTMKNLNDSIVKSMPHWTKIIAQVISWFVRLGDTALFVFSGIKDLIDYIPDGVKKVGLAIVGLNLLLKSGPVGLIVTTLSTLLLLLDDFRTYKAGGESQFSSAWKSIEKFYSKLSQSGEIDRFKNKVIGVFKIVTEVFDNLKKGAEKVLQTFIDNGFIDDVKETFENIGALVKKSFENVFGLISDVIENLQNNGILQQLESTVVDLITEFGKLFKLVSDVFLKIASSDETAEDFKTLANIISTVVTVAFKGLDLVLQSIVAALKFIRYIISGDIIEDTKSWALDAWGYNPDGTPKPSKNSAAETEELMKRFFPGYATSPSGITFGSNMQFSPTYNIFSNGSPESIGSAIQKNESQLMIRMTQGGKK